ncbi:DUF444 family protein [Rhodobacteraceae bacterium 2CG4]|uniref:UPF0229 protein GE300_17900 n=1 Tax=Halovulum marinum TaxID=2662447 RepID=A0A6L5Z5W8_9RHOB|nr:YeaH/YhbH family protein [Halovulum marinum]MSU91455.1 DUF444 family protein [Halovulum marinum]
MTQFIDRRLNPKDRSLGNRRRFIRRVRGAVKKAVDDAVRSRGVADIDRGESVAIPAGDITEPTFHHAPSGGHRERVLPGNKDFRAGDRIDKPPSGSGGGAGRQGAPDGDAEDNFLFALSRDEFLDLFFEDLELPDLVKRSLKKIETTRPRRAGISVTGAPANLSVERTMRNAIGRRIAMRRPGRRKLDALQREIEALEAAPGPEDEAGRDLLERLRTRLEALRLRQRRVPFLDPLDVRYTHFEMQPEPRANAVMFCLMDVSASMGEREKDLAKRFFALLHLFLMRRYDKVELVFIRHTHEAREVDEETFFYSRESGGTVVSTALTEMKRIIDARYAPSDWNIYAAQASDGDNYSGDSARCLAILNGGLMKLCQYFAYVEILRENEGEILNDRSNGTELWRAYLHAAEDWPNFALKRIARRGDIYPVFRELFAAGTEGADG